MFGLWSRILTFKLSRTDKFEKTVAIHPDLFFKKKIFRKIIHVVIF